MSKRFQIIIAGAVIVIILAVVFYFMTATVDTAGKTEKRTAVRSEPAEVNILFFGGTYSSAGEWKRFLSRKDVDICANVSFRQNQIKFTLENCVWEKTPKVCFINGGHEDIISNMPVDAILENYAWMVKRLQNRNIRPVIISTLRIPEMDERINTTIDDFNKQLMVIADTLDADYMNITELLCDKDGIRGKYITEGVKLNDQGYRVWAKEIKAYLEKKPI